MTMTKTDINGNTYIVICNPNVKGRGYKQSVRVYADEDGTDHGMPDRPADVGSSYRGYPYEKIHSETKYESTVDSFDSFVSRVVNEAVCKVEDKQDERDQTELKVEAALEANREIHGGIDYQLEQEQADG